MVEVSLSTRPRFVMLSFSSFTVIEISSGAAISFIAVLPSDTMPIEPVFAYNESISRSDVLLRLIFLFASPVTVPPAVS